MEELTKLYEHRLKELNKALEITQEAIWLLQVATDLTEAFKKRLGNDFVKREIRIKRKLFPGQAHKMTSED